MFTCSVCKHLFNNLANNRLSRALCLQNAVICLSIQTEYYFRIFFMLRVHTIIGELFCQKKSFNKRMSIHWQTWKNMWSDWHFISWDCLLTYLQNSFRPRSTNSDHTNSILRSNLRSTNQSNRVKIWSKIGRVIWVGGTRPELLTFFNLPVLTLPRISVVYADMKGKGKTKESASWTVHHYQFLEWPDKKIPAPERTDSILAFISDINDKWKETSYVCPLVVHCR